MAVMNVNPTRMELNKLKNKLITARRGHKLLKDKRDELIRQFFSYCDEISELREKVEVSLKSASEHMAVCCGYMSSEELDVALMLPSQKVSVDVEYKNIMGVTVPSFIDKSKLSDENNIYSYGFAFTSSELDTVVGAYSSVMSDMILLAEKEKTCQLLASEIEKTRRRVNALEYVMIPQYEETIRYISMRLDEVERSNSTRLIKVKDMLLEKAHEYI